MCYRERWLKRIKSAGGLITLGLFILTGKTGLEERPIRDTIMT